MYASIVTAYLRDLTRVEQTGEAVHFSGTQSAAKEVDCVMIWDDAQEVCLLALECDEADVEQCYILHRLSSFSRITKVKTAPPKPKIAEPSIRIQAPSKFALRSLISRLIDSQRLHRALAELDQIHQHNPHLEYNQQHPSLFQGYNSCLPQSHLLDLYHHLKSSLYQRAQQPHLDLYLRHL